MAPGQQQFGEIVCDANTFAIGGGVGSTGAFANQQSINSSYPSDGTGNQTSIANGNRGWAAYVDNRGATAQNFFVFVVCAPASSVAKAPDAATARAR